jgi:integrase
MKMKRPHRVPLARQAIVIFRELHDLAGQGECVFPAVESVRGCMSNNTLNAALCRLDYLKEEVSVSGFRATASILLRWAVESGRDRAAIGARKRHSPGGTCTRQSSGVSVSR